MFESWNVVGALRPGFFSSHKKKEKGMIAVTLKSVTHHFFDYRGAVASHCAFCHFGVT